MNYRKIYILESPIFQMICYISRDSIPQNIQFPSYSYIFSYARLAHRTFSTILSGIVNHQFSNSPFPSNNNFFSHARTEYPTFCSNMLGIENGLSSNSIFPLYDNLFYNTQAEHLIFSTILLGIRTSSIILKEISHFIKC